MRADLLALVPQAHGILMIQRACVAPEYRSQSIGEKRTAEINVVQLDIDYEFVVVTTPNLHRRMIQWGFVEYKRKYFRAFSLFVSGIGFDGCFICLAGRKLETVAL